jgi:predicted metal-dependent HD superfamily phosphohydrolase
MFNTNDEYLIGLLKERWGKITHLDSGYFYYIINAYNEPHRYYHNIHHLFDCFTVFDSVEHLVDHPSLMQIALFYHDVVYDPTAYDNELKSSDISYTALDYIIDKGAVHRLIMATRHKAKGYEGDNRYIVDIDLAILGSEPDIYDEYSNNIRKEYSMYIDNTYRVGRIKLLKKFLDKDHIYNTLVLRDRFESQAIKNISNEIKRLSI